MPRYYWVYINEPILSDSPLYVQLTCPRFQLWLYNGILVFFLENAIRIIYSPLTYLMCSWLIGRYILEKQKVYFYILSFGWLTNLEYILNFDIIVPNESKIVTNLEHASFSGAKMSSQQPEFHVTHILYSFRLIFIDMFFEYMWI